MEQRHHTVGRAVGALSATLLVALLCSAQARAELWPKPRVEAPQNGPHWYQTNGFPVDEADFPVEMVFLGSPPPGLDAERVEEAIAEAADAWSRVPCSFATVEYAGRRDTLEEVADDEYPIAFVDPDDTDCMDRGSIGMTALTCGEAYPDKTIFLNEAEYGWDAEPQPFQPAVVESQSGAELIVDVDSVVTHEVGHVLGLSHSEDRLATMYAGYRPDGRQADLAVDDKQGLCSLYGVDEPGDECRVGRDCPPTQRCGRVGESAMCREFRGEVGDVCRRDRLVCEEACVFGHDPRDEGYCTETCSPGEGECPQDFACTEGLVDDQESHCERIAPPDTSSCAGAGRAHPPAWWALAAIGALALRRRFSHRTSSSR